MPGVAVIARVETAAAYPLPPELVAVNWHKPFPCVIDRTRPSRTHGPVTFISTAAPDAVLVARAKRRPSLSLDDFPSWLPFGAVMVIRSAGAALELTFTVCCAEPVMPAGPDHVTPIVNCPTDGGVHCVRAWPFVATGTPDARTAPLIVNETVPDGGTTLTMAVSVAGDPAESAGAFAR